MKSCDTLIGITDNRRDTLRVVDLRMDALETPEVAEGDVGATTSLGRTHETRGPQRRIGQKRFHVPVLIENGGLARREWVFLRYVLVHSGVRQPSGCLTPHINVTDVRIAEHILVVNPLRP